jgi:hypothetical protein
LPLGRGARLGSAGLKLGELASFALDLGRRDVKPRLERAGDEAVLGFAGVELGLRMSGFELSALDREPLAGQALLVLALEHADLACAVVATAAARESRRQVQALMLTAPRRAAWAAASPSLSAAVPVRPSPSALAAFNVAPDTFAGFS